MDKAVWNLRTRRMYSVLYGVFCQTCDQGKFRMVHYSVQGNHLHLVVEAKDRAAMSKGMQRVGIRIALQLNKAMGRRKGRVLGDRYHEQHLESPRQVKYALGYVLCNFRKHLWQNERERCSKNWLDPFSSAEFFDGWNGATPEPGGPIAPARTWLLRVGWKKQGPLNRDLIPSPAGVR